MYTALVTSPSSPRRRWHRLRARAVGGLFVGGGGALIVAYLSLIVLIPIAALVCHGLNLAVSPNGAGLEFWRWHVSVGWRAFWVAITAPGAEGETFLAVGLSLAVD